MTARTLRPLLTAQQAAELLRVSLWTVRRECRAGNLQASRYGRAWHISEDSLREYVDAHMPAPAPAEPARRRRQRKRAA
jgi:excisionase family DNA binding protein